MSCLFQVLHSQRLSEKPLRPWVVAEKSGTVAAAHCNCMAGLGEACTHIAALLFAIDATVRIRDSKTVTDEKAYWLLPSDMKKVSYEPLKNIDFTSAATAKRKFEQSLDAISSPGTVCQTPKLPREDRTPEATDEDMDIFYRKLAKCNPTSAILSIVEPHCEKFIPKAISEDFPKVLTELKDDNCMTMTHIELKKHCAPLMNAITCDAQQKDAVENVTREQSLSKFWNTFRAGRVTASQAKAVCTSDPNDPSSSLIKRICYPGTNTFKNQATKWGNDNEKNALKAFNKLMMESHENVCLESSGFIISTKFPFIGASPDGVFSCDCCGKATVEVKCPFNLRNEGLDKCDYLVTDDSGDKCLKTNHQYYYQIQTQLGCSNLEFGYFIVWTENDIHVEQIMFDQVVWEKITFSAKNIFNAGILPELVGKYYTRFPTLSQTLKPTASCSTPPKSVLSAVCSNSSRDDQSNESKELYCFCQKEAYGKMIACDNQNCNNEWFHYQCVGIKRKPRGDWYCKECKR
jgi:putative phage-type endonuclease